MPKTLATNVKDAIDTFNAAVVAFNNWDEKAVGKLCDDNVVLVTVAKHTPITSKPNVEQYLKSQQWPVKPKFTPTTVQVIENQLGDSAQIVGTADWEDTDEVNDIDGQIRYAFNFIRKGNKWLISTLWGSSDEP
jgi:hypothetical protein